jgi:DNA-binding MarR family transcriptional regulator
MHSFVRFAHRSLRVAFLNRQVNLQDKLASLPVVSYAELVMARKTLETSVLDFTQAIGLLVRRVRAAAASHELSLTESAVLGRLMKDGPATTAELARLEGMKPQSMGTTVAALEERGLIERTPHATDGRQMLIQLTDKGLAVRKSTREAKQMWLAQSIARLDKQEQETLLAAGEIIKRLAEM